MLKEILYTGLGGASILKDKVEEELEKLQERGKIDTEDTKSFLKSLEERGKEQDEKIKESIKESLKEVISELGIATKDDLEKLKKELK